MLLTIGAGWFFWRAMNSPYKGYSEAAKRVEVRKGQRTSTILHHLQAEGVIRDEYIPLVWMKLSRHSDSLKAGVYEFTKPLTPVEVLQKIMRGDVILRTVTVREGLDRFAVGRLFAAERFGKAEEWDRLTGEAELIRDIAPEATSLEGFLFPDTYKFNPGTPVKTIVAAMVQNFRRHFSGEMNYIATGLSLHQTVTLASLVETEAKLENERALVASVYLNRFRRNMLLGADPTVIYAMKLNGKWDGNIKKTDLAMESPYNTYRVHGFPPGPIASPGLAALRAAAAPATTQFIYFVAKHDGSHAFSTNVTEHNRNVDVYQRQWYRNNKKQ